MAPIVDLFGYDEAQGVAVERDRRLDIGDEQAHRADPDDLEGPGQQDALDVVNFGQGIGVPEAGDEIDALGLGVLDLLALRFLG